MQKTWITAIAVWLACAAMTPARAGNLALPPRPPDAPKGSAFADTIANLDLTNREAAIVAEVLHGNVPDFWRRFVNVTVKRNGMTAVYEAAPDYLCIGSDDDYLLMPISPQTAQLLADKLDCVMPTPRMVSDIYAAAEVKLAPIPIPPSSKMTTVPVFIEHNKMVRQQRAETLAAHPPGALVAGDMKDLVLTARLAGTSNKVAIFGWHRPGGTPIQPLYTGHASTWVDYSQGTRFVRQSMTVDGEATTISEVLADTNRCVLLSDEGPLLEPRFGNVRPLETPSAPTADTKFHERNEILHFDPGVRVWLNSPDFVDAAKPVRLIIYALPNGNTIEQTIGRKPRPGDDWHFDIQNIGAQLRWLRQHGPEETWVIAYFQCEGNAWPAWLTAHDANGHRAKEMVGSVRGRFTNAQVELVLTGHSGGGALTFAYIDAVDRIPDDVERIAFLDSDYRYDSAKGHDAKLIAWLESMPRHSLCVLAYHDSIALLNRKTFVSENGGTWGRSHALQSDLAKKFSFTRDEQPPWERFTALEGRVKFLFHENPDHAVLHTKQVELNGFIHAMLTGTPAENRDYTYFGPRAYGGFISD